MSGVAFQLLLASRAGIGTPVSLGATGGSGSATTVALTASANIAAGDLVVVSIGHLTLNTTTVSSVSDGTNTYTRAISGTLSTNQEAELWYCANCAAVASPVITVTFSAACAFRAVGAARVSGAKTADTGVAASGTTATPSVATGTLAHAVEVVFGFLHINGTPTITEASGFTQLFSDTASGGTNHLAYQLVSATTSVTYAPSENSSNASVIMVASFY